MSLLSFPLCVRKSMELDNFCVDEIYMCDPKAGAAPLEKARTFGESERRSFEYVVETQERRTKSFGKTNCKFWIKGLPKEGIFLGDKISLDFWPETTLSLKAPGIR